VEKGKASGSSNLVRRGKGGCLLADFGGERSLLHSLLGEKDPPQKTFRQRGKKKKDTFYQKGGEGGFASLMRKTGGRGEGCTSRIDKERDPSRRKGAKKVTLLFRSGRGFHGEGVQNQEFGDGGGREILTSTRKLLLEKGCLF